MRLKEVHRLTALSRNLWNIRFSEVGQRLDRMDATLTNLGKQLAAGTRTIAGFTEWISNADGDY